MREIKFKAWCNEHKVIFHPSYFDFEHSKIINVIGNKCAGDGFVDTQGHDKNSYVLLQFTCVKDKNRKEIYEGDIVNVKTIWFEETYVIVADGPRFVGKFIKKQEHNLDIVGWDQFPDGIEIIGNIYETPELFEKSK